MLTSMSCNNSEVSTNEIRAGQNGLLKNNSSYSHDRKCDDIGSSSLDRCFDGQGSIWRREYGNHLPDLKLKSIKDHMIMAELYASIARSEMLDDLAGNLTDLIQECENLTSEANSDADLLEDLNGKTELLEQTLSAAREMLYDCPLISSKLIALMQSTEESIAAQKGKNNFLMQYASRTMPKSLLCLHLELANDYYFRDYEFMEMGGKNKLEDPSLYHYALFSDNVLAASVVVKSAISHVEDPKKHVFHIVTDRLTYAPLKTWFITHSVDGASVEVQSLDDLAWFKTWQIPFLHPTEPSGDRTEPVQPSSKLERDGTHRNINPKYLSSLNYLRFHLPDLFPKLKKILFLDDDVVVQYDLTPLWSVDLEGMVNGAVENCGNDLNRLSELLNFFDHRIKENFDPLLCIWNFGVNMFDLVEWKKRNITGRYLFWQQQNKDGTLWKLGSLPLGQVVFHNATYRLSPTWHLTSLGYNPVISPSEIEAAKVIHYNGN